MQSRLLTSNTNGVKTLAWSPDSNLIAVASNDKTIRIWNRSGKLLKQLKGHKSLIYFIAWAPIGDVLVSAEAGYSSREDMYSVLGFWYKNGDLLRWQKIPSIQALAWSAKGLFLATGSRDKIIRLWNEDGLPIRELEGHKRSVYSLAWSPTSGLLASSGADGEILFWDEHWKFTKVHHEGARGDITRLAWAPDGKILASYRGGSILFWNEEGKCIQTLIDIKGSSLAHTEDIINIKWSSDNSMLASVSWDRTVRLWDRTGDCFRILGIPDARSQSYLLLVPRSISWSSDSTILASTYNDGTLRLWNTEGGCIGTLKLNFIRKETSLRKDSMSLKIESLFGTEEIEDSDDSVLYSPDGKTLALWERNSGTIAFLEWITDKSKDETRETFNEVESKGIKLTEQMNLCLICRQKFLNTDGISICNYCNSIFHANCIMDWILEEQHKICPRCNNLFIRK